jgi:hypothetical protein
MAQVSTTGMDRAGRRSNHRASGAWTGVTAGMLPVVCCVVSCTRLVAHGVGDEIDGTWGAENELGTGAGDGRLPVLLERPFPRDVRAVLDTVRRENARGGGGDGVTLP